MKAKPMRKEQYFMYPDYTICAYGSGSDAELDLCSYTGTV
jgi:hypothetical protein